jgi:multidrug efflux pump subunit AcrB
VRVALATLAAARAACGGDGGPGGVVTVRIELPGAYPAEVEQQVLVPLEVAAARLGGVHALRGRASGGVATLEVTFARGTDLVGAQARMHQVLVDAGGTLPPDASAPVIERSPAAWVLARFVDHPKHYDALHGQLIRLPVVRIEQCGARAARIALELAPSKLGSYGLTPAEVAAAIAAEDVNVPAGRVVKDGDQLSIRVSGAMSSYDTIADIVVGTAGDGSSVRVRDIAVITQRAEARCLVEGPADGKKAALLRVGVRSAKDVPAVEKELTRAKHPPLRKAFTVRRAGRPTRVEILAAPAGPIVEAVVAGDDARALADQGGAALVALREDARVAAAWCEGCEVDETDELHVDRARAADRGVAIAHVAQALRIAGVGELVSTYRDRDLEVGVVLGVEEGGARWPDLAVRGRDGQLVALRDLVTVSTTRAPREIVRVDRRRAVVVRLRGGPKTSVAELRTVATSVLPAAQVRTVDPARVDAQPW